MLRTSGNLFKGATERAQFPPAPWRIAELLERRILARIFELLAHAQVTPMPEHQADRQAKD
ncbi:hypothetical protein OK349_04285 [Sphingomonas sp. BT-65]|uniref:hypothetical protein n=1 Tax=Sphingomonas sp. BT-65 TaxID=2989821 RepID=UPI002236910C|nr:hypothetical protein [Sphingomonas sp. BT-65]MCW4460913.1 hypothetical protein [Sphingomonas sp. BT-65]